MKQILILGAGQSAPYLIAYLLEQAKTHNWFVTVGDRNLELASQRVGGHPNGTAISFDVRDASMRSSQIKKVDVVVNMLAPKFQALVALDCIHYGSHMISASYRDKNLRDMEKDAQRKGVLVLSEMGLDPGIDLMSAMSLIQSIRDRGGIITRFNSYGGGLPAPEDAIEPLKYFITWNPRNVVMAGEYGTQYREDGQIKIVGHYNVFRRTWPVDVDGVGTLEAYANRDSISYQEVFGLEKINTMIRGSLRFPGWSETWLQIVRLGLPNENLRIENVKNLTYREFIEMFLPLHTVGSRLEQRVASFLQISPTGRIMENLKWLGLFSDEPIDCHCDSPAEVMVHLLKQKLALPADARDMVILVNEMTVKYPDENKREENITSTMVHYGEPGGFTAMSKTVGLPAAIAAKLLLLNKLSISGCHIPTHPTVYVPVLKELEGAGIKFKNKVVEII